MFQGPLFQVTIDELHQRLTDNQFGFQECISCTTDESLKEKFGQIAEKRGQMMHDLEVYGGAMQSPWGSVKGGLAQTLTQAWVDIQTGLKEGAKVGEAISEENTKLKKVYDSALKSRGIASSLNGLLLEHIRKIESDMKDIESMFGIERKMSQPSSELPTLQRSLSVGEKIKSALGIETSSVNFEKPTLERRQSIGDKIKSVFGIETTSASFEQPKLERRESFGDKIKSAFGIETSSVSFEQPKVERRQSLGDKIKSAFRTDSPATEATTLKERSTAQDKAIQKAALSLDDRVQTYKKQQKAGEAGEEIQSSDFE